MSYKKLLDQLRNKTFIQLKSSPIHGIGVFAINTIPKGCREIFSEDQGNWIKVPIKEVEELPQHSKALIETYCLFDEENYFVPEYGFNIIDPVIYLNHSSEPNIKSINDGEQFEALREIKIGEELMVNYGDLVDGMDDYK